MNDRDLLEQLDRRAHTAAGDLRALAAARAVPPAPVEGVRGLPAPGPSTARPLPSRRLMAAAAAIVLVAGAVGIGVATHDRHRNADPADVISTDPPPYVASYLPKGFTIIQVGDSTRGRAAAGAAGRTDVYGRSLDDPGLGVTVAGQFALDDVANGRRVEVDGVAVHAFDGLGLGSHAVIRTVAKVSVLFSSPTLDDDALARIAAHATVEGLHATLRGGDLPTSWSYLGTTIGSSAIFGPTAASSGVPGRFVAYGKRDTSGAGLFVESSPGDELRQSAARLMYDDATEVVVHGREAILGHVSSGSGEAKGTITRLSVLAWIEAPGQMLQVTAYGISDTELRATADGLEVPTAPRWKALIEQSELGDLTSGHSGAVVEEIGRGRFPDGTAWVVRLQTFPDERSVTDASPEPSIDLGIALARDEDAPSNVGDGQSSSEGPGGSGAMQGTAIVARGHRHFAAGLLRDDVASVVLLDSSGQEVTQAKVVGDGKQKAWVAEIPDGPLTAVARSASGAELGRTAVDSADADPDPGETSSSSSKTSGSASGSDSSTATTGAPAAPGGH